MQDDERRRKKAEAEKMRRREKGRLTRTWVDIGATRVVGAVVASISPLWSASKISKNRMDCQLS